MSDDGEDLGAMAWPGFVDILSSVIIMFVFFVMVVASALYFHIIIFKSKILSEISEYTTASSRAEELGRTNRSLMEKIEDLEEKMEVLEQVTDKTEVQLFQKHTEFAESTNQKFEENTEARSLTIFFGADSISVTKDNEKLLGSIIEQYAKKFTPAGTVVKIISGKDEKSVNDIVARRLSVARMLNTRNLFLETDIPSNQVIPSISSGEEIDGSYNWVKIVFEKK